MGQRQQEAAHGLNFHRQISTSAATPGLATERHRVISGTIGRLQRGKLRACVQFQRPSRTSPGVAGRPIVSIDLLDTSRATNIAGSRYDGTTPVAPGGKLVEGIVPATLTRYIDINDTAELNKFGLHNGEPNDRNNLSEKWEGMALAPALDPANPNDYFLFISNDNDFITQNGFQAGAAYKDASGVDVDTMILVYRVTLPVQLN
jgi:hypothetical protein